MQYPLENKEREDKGQVSRGTFLLFSYLYFIQGVIIGLIGTMPYIYPTLPDIDTMALFNSISLPYSFKFLIGTSLSLSTISLKIHSHLVWKTQDLDHNQSILSSSNATHRFPLYSSVKREAVRHTLFCDTDMDGSAKHRFAFTDSQGNH